jgi:hypothetical protein
MATTDTTSTMDPAALGQAAFRHISAREFDAARPLVERALALDPHSGVLAHARAHLTTESGAFEEGAEYLRAFLADHDPHAGINVHNAWHLASLEVAVARPAAALAWYEDVVAPHVRAYPMTFFGAASLLWRLELCDYGAALRARGETLPWQEARVTALALGATLDEGGERNGSPLLNEIGRAMIFLGSGDNEQLAGVVDRLRAADPAVNAVAAELVLPFVLGLQAYWHGDYTGAVHLIAPIAPSFERITPIPDFLNVFEQSLLEARRRAG